MKCAKCAEKQTVAGYPPWHGRCKKTGESISTLSNCIIKMSATERKRKESEAHANIKKERRRKKVV